MPATKSDSDQVPIVRMQKEDALEVARLFAGEMPWSIFSKMGRRFTARFIRWMQEQEKTEVWVAKNAHADVLGISCGTLDRPGIYRNIVRMHFIRLAWSTLLNLYRPAVIAWLLRAIWERLRPGPQIGRSALRPAAEWIFLTVIEAARGKGLAHRFHDRMVADFREWGLQGPYVVLPLASNKQAQAFHKKHGAKFIGAVPTRGHLIYEYHKTIPPSDTESHTKV